MDDSEKLKNASVKIVALCEKLRHATARAKVVSKAVADAHAASEEVKQQFADSIEQTFVGMQHLTSLLEVARSTATEIEAQVQEGSQELQLTLSTQGNEVSTSSDQTRLVGRNCCDGLGHFVDHSAENQQKFASAMDTYHQATAEQERGISHITDSATSSIAEACDKIQTVVAAATEALDSTVDTLQRSSEHHQHTVLTSVERLSAFATKVDGEVIALFDHDVKKRIEALVELAVQEIEQRATAIVDETVDKITAAIDEVVENTSSESAESEAVRELLRPLIDELSEKTEPLRELAEGVQHSVKKLSLGSLFGI